MINRDPLTPEEQAEIDAAIAEADLGGGILTEEVLRELRVRTRREECTDVEVSAPADQEFDLTEEQETFIEESIAEIERGEFVDGDEIIAELRRRAGLL